MKTIADWKSKTNLNNMDDDDNDENNLRTFNNEENRLNANSGTARLFQKYQQNSGPKLMNNDSENSIKPERYLDLVKDLKKKYTRSRTEVSFYFLNKFYLNFPMCQPVHRFSKPADDEVFKQQK